MTVRTIIAACAATGACFVACSLTDTDNGRSNAAEDTPAMNQTSVEEAFPGQYGEVREGPVALNGEVVTVSYQRIGGKNVMEGDIILPDESIGRATGAMAQSVTYLRRRWPNNTVNYVIAKNVYDEQLIRDAIAYVERNTILVFVEGKASSYIEFIPDSGSWSLVGRKGGKQQIGIAGWSSRGNVVHEIGHALGLLHEQCRADRDTAITIHWGNISKPARSNFNNYRDSKHADVDGFDFDSIMLYSSWAFSANGDPTITRTDGSTFSTQRDHLSEGDLRGIARLYAATGKTVALYQLADYRGASASLGAGDYFAADLAKRRLGDNALSSLRVGAGLRVVAYADDACQGPSETYFGNLRSLAEDSFDDAVSSLQVLSMRDWPGYYRIVARGSGKVVAADDAGTRILEADWSGADTQRWKIEPVGDNTFRLTSKPAGAALAADPGSAADGAPLRLATPDETGAQLWRIEPASGTSCRIVADSTGKTLEATGEITQTSWIGDDVQLWKIERVE